MPAFRRKRLRLAALLTGLALLAGPAGAPRLATAAQPDQQKRPAVLAGSWYAAEPDILARNVDLYLRQGGRKVPAGRLVALITPHAGHRYSGAVAGAAWSVAGAQDPLPLTVILVGPSHQVYLRQPSVWLAGDYATPLGDIPVDRILARELAERLGADFHPAAHLREHSLEVQFPFLRRAVPEARLVTVLTGPPDPAQTERLGRTLAEVAQGRRVLLAASTDLSHFHDEATAKLLDAQAARRIAALDAEGLMADEAAGRAEACGLQGVAAVLIAARLLGAGQGQILATASSAQATGDRSRVVGYLAAAVSAGPAQAGAFRAPMPAAPAGELDPARQERLRVLARRAVEAAVHGRPAPAPPSDDPVLGQPRGVFVTLRQNHELRGCIGAMAPRLPLGQAVVEMAGAAALRDPRFLPVTPAELPDLELELSVLTPFEPCDPEQVRVGVDGLLIEARGKSGVLLPQVPAEQGWDRLSYLEGICQKAGLPAGAWRQPGVRLYRFQAQVF